MCGGRECLMSFRIVADVPISNLIDLTNGVNFRGGFYINPR